MLWVGGGKCYARAGGGAGEGGGEVDTPFKTHPPLAGWRSRASSKLIPHANRTSPSQARVISSANSRPRRFISAIPATGSWISANDRSIFSPGAQPFGRQTWAKLSHSGVSGGAGAELK